VKCGVCERRFYSVAGGEGTELSPRFEPKPRRRRRPADPRGPALGYASLGCVLFFPLLAAAVAHWVPESGAALLTMGSVLAIGFGAAFGFGGLKLADGFQKVYGGLGLALATLQAAWLAAAVLAYGL
jgi:hypothetical protein